MTTAARPTFDPARGGTQRGETDLTKLSKQYSSRDMPAHTKLKYRQPGQTTSDDVKDRDLRRELEDREKTGKDKDKRTTKDVPTKKPRLDQITSGNVDADDVVEDDDDEDEESDEDDTAELMAELNRIKKERAADKAKQEAEKKAEEEKIRTENILVGNPLLSGSGKSDFKVKRRWDDDVVFKNCAKGLDDKKKESTFINDALRSEFHKKFMEKYVK